MNQPFEVLQDRAIITLSGPERRSLLQGIITNNVSKLDNGGLYAALLTPQGKFLFDFFLYEVGDCIYLDCEKESMPQLFQKLLMYRLRSNVEIIDRSADFTVISSSEKLNEDISFIDPRLAEMGYRSIVADIPSGDQDNHYHAQRISLGIPEGSYDFISDKSTILEGHFIALNGVDFEKGCYVGQEVTARMKYRSTLKKMTFPVTLSGPAPQLATVITDEKGNKIGDLRSHCDKNAIALIKLSAIEFGKEYDCSDIKVTPYKPDWMGDILDGG